MLFRSTVCSCFLVAIVTILLSLFHHPWQGYGNMGTLLRPPVGEAFTQTHASVPAGPRLPLLWHSRKSLQSSEKNAEQSTTRPFRVHAIQFTNRLHNSVNLLVGIVLSTMPKGFYSADSWNVSARSHHSGTCTCARS